MAKNIIVFCDGTGQEGGKSSNTNIYYMFNMILDRTPQQIACYIPGVGTGTRKITGNISGNGISANIKLCYRFIFDHFESGDQIFLIGFSRGAATVRSLSSFIHYFGILPQARPKLIDRAYQIYKIRDIEERKNKATDFIELNRTMWTKIKFLGCYDTVMCWMLQQAIKHGLLLYPQHKIRLEENANGHMHNSRGTRVTRLYRKMSRTWDTARTDKPVIHQSVLERTHNQMNLDNPRYHPWIIDLDYEIEPWVRHDQFQLVTSQVGKKEPARIRTG